MPHKKKVFCRFCKHNENRRNCIHPKNLIDTWFEPEGVTGDPWESNKNNDCKLFEKENG